MNSILLETIGYLKAASHGRGHWFDPSTAHQSFSQYFHIQAPWPRGLIACVRRLVRISTKESEPLRAPAPDFRRRTDPALPGTSHEGGIIMCIAEYTRPDTTPRRLSRGTANCLRPMPSGVATEHRQTGIYETVSRSAPISLPSEILETLKTFRQCVSCRLCRLEGVSRRS